VVGISLAAIVVFMSGRRARLVRFGVPALGIVGEVAENDSVLKFARTFRLTYRFTDGNGQSWAGRGPPQPWTLAARWDPGETILVLYDSRNPKRNEPDVWEARQDYLAELQDRGQT